MAGKIWNVDWLVQNSQRRYPLTNNVTAKDVTGSFELPDDFLVGLRLPVHYGLDVTPDRFVLYQLGIYAAGFSIQLGYDTGAGIVPVAAGSFSSANHQFGNVYQLGGVGDFWDCLGQVAIGNLGTIAQQPPGLFTFNAAGGALDADIIRPYLRTIQALYVKNGAQLSKPLVGDIVLVAGQNMLLTPQIIDGQNTQIVVSAIDGAGLNEDCDCQGQDPGPPMTNINTIRPRSDGSFDLEAQGGIELEPLEHGILIKNLLTPCCGCPELETVTSTLQQLLPRVVTVEGKVQNLGAAVDQFNMTVLGSRLNDQSCDTCD